MFSRPESAPWDSGFSRALLQLKQHHRRLRGEWILQSPRLSLGAASPLPRSVVPSAAQQREDGLKKSVVLSELGATRPPPRSK